MIKNKTVKNPGLGLCYILKENSYGYLIYSVKNGEHFIIVREIRRDSFYFNDYFSSLDKALEYFNSLGKEKE